MIEGMLPDTWSEGDISQMDTMIKLTYQARSYLQTIELYQLDQLERYLLEKKGISIDYADELFEWSYAEAGSQLIKNTTLNEAQVYYKTVAIRLRDEIKRRNKEVDHVQEVEEIASIRVVDNSRIMATKRMKLYKKLGIIDAIKDQLIERENLSDLVTVLNFLKLTDIGPNKSNNTEYRTLKKCLNGDLVSTNIKSFLKSLNLKE